MRHTSTERPVFSFVPWVAKYVAASFVALLLASLLAGLAQPLFAATHSQGRLGAGADWATEYFIQESGKPGPTVMITGGLHGNEPAGAVSANQIRHWPILRGRLVILPRANVLALRANSRYSPDVARDLRNLNRNFPRSDQKESLQGGPARGALAGAIWSLVKEQKPNWLLDLHEGFDYNKSNSKSVGSSLIIHPSEATELVATMMLEAVNETVATEDLKFVRLREPVDGSLARAAGEHLGANAMIVETTTKGQPVSRRARQHRIAVQRLLRHLKMIDAQVTADLMTDRDADRLTRVALYDAGGTGGKGVPKILKILSEAKELNSNKLFSNPHEDNGSANLRKPKEIAVQRVGPEDIRSGVLDQFDVVIFSGGTGSGQAKALSDKGRREVKQFVEEGAGYVGICAGAYLACDGFSWGLKILDAKTASPKWRRGKGQVKVELTDRGQKLLGKNSERFDILYANGPILVPADSAALPDYQPLAFFRSELSKNGAPPGVMRDSPAIVAGRCGQGRVMCFSPHPEQSEGLEPFILSAIKWTARRETALADPSPAE